MIKYLYYQKDYDALNYLRFAKNCEYYNSWQDDPWERKEYLALEKRKLLFNIAIERSEKIKNTDLKRRYSFLAIRLAWYNHNFEKITTIFNTIFKQAKQKDIIYYWSLYFKSTINKNKAEANYELAQVFCNATDKRFTCHQYYNANIRIEQALEYCKNNTEKANVYILYGIENPEKALPYLKKIYQFKPSCDGLSFLLLRELNKIEDYVFTPYYTLFEPSTSNSWSSENKSVREILNRSERDRLYAKEVLNFVNVVNLKNIENPIVWQCSKAYLEFITRNYNDCLQLTNKLENLTSDKNIFNQLEIIKSLTLIANQERGHASINNQIQTTLINNKNNNQLIFAIAKELEYLDNSTDAALLYSKNESVFWKATTKIKNFNNDYFFDYFEYIDEVYTPKQIRNLIDDIQKNKNRQNIFSVFKYQNITKDLERLYDLLGTKYMRQNKLDTALAIFEKIENKYWYQTYTEWGDGSNFFTQNPFYQLNYTPKFIPTEDTIKLNKCSITRQLINYINKAENKYEQNRDYYYFLIGNAYYNMCFEGNIYMMRRLRGWSEWDLSVFEDETEFRQTNLAKQYYLLAKKYAKTEKFKALCLRMVIHCEKNKLNFLSRFENNNYYNIDFDSLYITNKYFIEFQKKYPAYLNDLISNCDNFEAYFKARRL